MKKNEKGFGIVEIILILVLLCFIGGLGWVGWYIKVAIKAHNLYRIILNSPTMPLLHLNRKQHRHPLLLINT